MSTLTCISLLSALLALMLTHGLRRKNPRYPSIPSGTFDSSSRISKYPPFGSTIPLEDPARLPRQQDFKKEKRA